jgi:hypothetical protein
MSHRLSPGRRSRFRAGPGALYVGSLLLLILAAFTVRSIWSAWQVRSGEARAQAVFDLVGQRTALRPTDAPGAMAWLRLQLDRYADRLGDAERTRLFRSLSAGSDAVPPGLSHLAAALRLPPTAASPAVRWMPSDSAQTPGAGSLRVARLVTLGDSIFVVSRRARLDDGDSAGAALNAFVAEAAARIGSAAGRIAADIAARPLPSPTGGPARIIRVYAVGEDGTLVSLPWESSAAAARAERLLLRARPFLPSFAPEEFFFRPEAGETTAAYSGFYLDLGGRGLVSTVLAPFAAADGSRGVMALDVSFDLDWRAFAASVEPPVHAAAIVSGTGELGPSADWPALSAHLPADAPGALVAAMAALAQAAAGPTPDSASIRHAVVAGQGAVAAFYVADGTWLLMLYPSTAPAFPVAAIALLAVLLGVLLGGFEVNRRRAERERRAAIRAFDEKQNLLNTMQVPLVVVDPNTDVVVSSNHAAETLGIRAGSPFADLVWPDPAARAHYERMQVATPEPRRAYGLPVRIQGPRGEAERRFALVRSVAVTAPIESLAADERHRLGVLFLIDPEADLALYTSEVEQAAERRERQRLAGLLSHGVETLARVLEHSLCSAPGPDAMSRFVPQLAEYLERRLQVTAWLLDHWDAAPPLARASVVDAAQARATIDRLLGIFEFVRQDRELRARLHWDNGTLAGSTTGPVVDVIVDWPETFIVTTPVRGGFGFFLGEVLTNAVRHGRAGTTPRCGISADRVRSEIEIEVRNDVGSTPLSAGEPYGGVRILHAMARLFEWRDLVLMREDGQFVARWRMPASIRSAPGDAD